MKAQRRQKRTGENDKLWFKRKKNKISVFQAEEKMVEEKFNSSNQNSRTTLFLPEVEPGKFAHSGSP